MLALLAAPGRAFDGHLAQCVRWLAENLPSVPRVAVASNAEAARLAAVERERAASLEGSVELLRAIAGVLDIRTVFPQVSEITNKVLPHDCMTMTFYDRDEVVVEAASNDEFPDFKRVKRAGVGRWRVPVIEDLTQEPLPIVEPRLQVHLVATGYRSWLSVLLGA